MLDVNDNYISLLNLYYKNHLSIFILPIILLILLFLTYNIEIYDTKSMNYIYNDGYYSITIPIQDSDNVINSNYVVIDNKKYDFVIDSILYDYQNAYQTILIKVLNKEGRINNQVGTIIFNFNKEKIIKKIINLLF